MTNIASSPIVLFLGAGATAPLGKMLMNQFVAFLSSKPEFSQNGLFSEITRKDPDLEFLLEELQDLERKNYLKDRDAIGNIISPRLIGSGNARSDFPAVAPSPQANWYAREAAPLRKLVEREVYHAYRSFDSVSPAKIKKHFKPLLDLILKNLGPGVPVIVFTTNYDPAIEVLCTQYADEFELCDGFEYNSRSRDFAWSPHGFENVTPMPGGKRMLVLVKLHGSTNWFTDDCRIIRGPHVFAGEDQDHRNVLIYPAKRKVATEEPYFTAYFCLHEILARARCLLSIGYSFRDYDALTRIMSAQRRNSGLEIAVVSPDAHRIDGDLTLRGLNSICTIPHKYDTDDTQFQLTLGLIDRWFSDSLQTSQ